MMTERLEQDLLIDWHRYESELMSLCQTKADEFHLLGYEEVTAEEIWTCVHRQARGKLALHELVSAILGLQVSRFMNYLTMNAFRGLLDEEVTSFDDMR